MQTANCQRGTLRIIEKADNEYLQLKEPWKLVMNVNEVE